VDLPQARPGADETSAGCASGVTKGGDTSLGFAVAVSGARGISRELPTGVLPTSDGSSHAAPTISNKTAGYDTCNDGVRLRHEGTGRRAVAHLYCRVDILFQLFELVAQVSRGLNTAVLDPWQGSA
jgi:hypothetical protein